MYISDIVVCFKKSDVQILAHVKKMRKEIKHYDLKLKNSRTQQHALLYKYHVRCVQNLDEVFKTHTGQTVTFFFCDFGGRFEMENHQNKILGDIFSFLEFVTGMHSNLIPFSLCHSAG